MLLTWAPLLRALTQASDWPLQRPVAWGCVAAGAAVCMQPPQSKCLKFLFPRVGCPCMLAASPASGDCGWLAFGMRCGSTPSMKATDSAERW
eukprot:11274470-Alexandrium_andersonii.AAC.1